jgi:GTP-binding protein Era
MSIERLLGCRVFLELFVKVQKNWTDSDRLLKEFGYH